MVMLWLVYAFNLSYAGLEEKKIRVVDDDGTERQMVRLGKSESEDRAVEIYNKVKMSLTIIKGQNGVGSGFVVEADGKIPWSRAF